MTAAPYPSPENPQHRPLHILLADDSPISRIVTKVTLESVGHRVLAVVNGVETLQALQGSSYDAVVLDGQMPELDGAETTRAIRNHADAAIRALPIVGLTAGEADDRAVLVAAGMDSVVAKPLDARAFEEAVLAALAMREKLIA